ncbi:MAG: PQQ-like beta-propeller repeat protein [Candidatus Kerfeldbacteria bacterium]|nr:PQQ-like beta-propeller repeat protein [Candidatus Kerfeldbacteria bacterium]
MSLTRRMFTWARYLIGSAGLLGLIVALPAEAWRPTSDHFWPMFHGNYTHSGYAAVKGPRHATLQWKFQAASGEVNSVPPNSVAIDAEGTIYVGGPTKVYALNTDGTEKWSKEYTNVQGPALSANGKTLYFAGNNQLVAVKTKNGKQRWAVAMGNSTIFGPTIAEDGTIYQGSWDGYLYAINKDGTVKWQFLTGGAVSYPATLGKKGTIYLGGGDAHSGPDSIVYALKPDGTVKWQYDTGATRNGSPAVGKDGLIYVPTGSSLVVLNKDGTLAWELGPNMGDDDSDDGSDGDNGGNDNGGGEPPPGDDGEQLNSIAAPGDIAGIITPALADDGTIYVGNSNGEILAIDGTTHTTKWTYQTGVSLTDSTLYGIPSFPVVDKTGALYIGSVDGKMYAMKKDGSVLWSYQTAGPIAEAAPALGPDGTLYFSSDDGYVYAMNE